MTYTISPLRIYSKPENQAMQSPSLKYSFPVTAALAQIITPSSLVFSDIDRNGCTNGYNEADINEIDVESTKRKKKRRKGIIPFFFTNAFNSLKEAQRNIKNKYNKNDKNDLKQTNKFRPGKGYDNKYKSERNQTALDINSRLIFEYKQSGANYTKAEIVVKKKKEAVMRKANIKAIDQQPLKSTTRAVNTLLWHDSRGRHYVPVLQRKEGPPRQGHTNRDTIAEGLVIWRVEDLTYENPELIPVWKTFPINRSRFAQTGKAGNPF